MQSRSIHEPLRPENERTYLQLKPEVRQTLYIAAWAITAVMGVAGVTTYYSTHPTAVGAVMAFLLFLGFMLTMKSASAILFDTAIPGILRFFALLCIFAVVVIDVFAFSHEKQTGVMERIESAQAVQSVSASKTERIRSLEAQLAACPPNHYTKCKTPLLQAIQTVQNAPDTLTFNAQNAGENRYWLALAEWYNAGKLPENQVDAGSIALYVFAGMGLAGSLFVVFTFGVHGISVSRPGAYYRPAPIAGGNPRTYRQNLEALGVPVPPTDTVLDQPLTDERTSTLNGSESAPETAGDAYYAWKRAVMDGQCDTIVRDVRIWLQDVGIVEQGKGKQAQQLAERYLEQAQAEGFIREIPNWVSGMRRKYELTGQGG